MDKGGDLTLDQNSASETLDTYGPWPLLRSGVKYLSKKYFNVLLKSFLMVVCTLLDYLCC